MIQKIDQKYINYKCSHFKIKLPPYILQVIQSHILIYKVNTSGFIYLCGLI